MIRQWLLVPTVPWPTQAVRTDSAMRNVSAIISLRQLKKLDRLAPILLFNIFCSGIAITIGLQWFFPF